MQLPSFLGQGFGGTSGWSFRKAKALSGFPSILPFFICRLLCQASYEGESSPYSAGRYRQDGMWQPFLLDLSDENRLHTDASQPLEDAMLLVQKSFRAMIFHLTYSSCNTGEPIRPCYLPIPLRSPASKSTLRPGNDPQATLQVSRNGLCASELWTPSRPYGRGRYHRDPDLSVGRQIRPLGHLRASQSTGPWCPGSQA